MISELGFLEQGVEKLVLSFEAASSDAKGDALDKKFRDISRCYRFCLLDSLSMAPPKRTTIEQQTTTCLDVLERHGPEGEP